MQMLPCPGCRRHVRVAADACPFCSGELPPAPPALAPGPAYSRLSRAAVFAGAAIAGTACWSGSQAKPSETTPDPPAETTPDQQPPPPPQPTAAGTGTIRGTITNSHSGRPLAHAQLTLIAPDGSQRAVHADGRGAYTLSGLPPGNYRLVLPSNHPRRPPAERRVTLKAGDTIQVNLAQYIPPPSNIPMPYGAPPARHRVV